MSWLTRSSQKPALMREMLFLKIHGLLNYDELASSNSKRNSKDNMLSLNSHQILDY